MIAPLQGTACCEKLLTMDARVALPIFSEAVHAVTFRARSRPVVSSDCKDFDVSVVAQSLQDGLTILPGQSKRTYIGEAKTSHGVAYGIVIDVFELPLHHSHLRPVNQIIQRNLMMEVRRQLTSYRFSYKGHGFISPQFP
jgi:hypothetical protein